MKAKFLLYSVILMLSLVASLHAQVRYTRSIPIQLPGNWLFEPKYTPKQIYPTPDGGVIILGDCVACWGDPDFPYHVADCGAIKLDAYGNCEWQWWSRDFQGWGESLIVGIDQEADGRVNFLINVAEEYNQMGWIDPQQNYSLQEIHLPVCFLNRAMRLSDNSIFAIGWVPVPHNSSAFFLHLNAQGDTLSSRSYPPDSLWIYPEYQAVAYDMEIDTDGMPVTTCIFTDYFASIVKTDWNGNIIWRRDTNTPLYQQAIPITKNPITNEIIFGYQKRVNEVNNKFIIYKCTATELDSLYSIQMCDTDWCYGGYYSIIAYNSGLLLSGFYNHQVHLSKYNFIGQNFWSWTMNSYYNYFQPTDCITVLPDSCIMHVFGSMEFGDYGLTIIKLNPDGTPNEDEYIQKPDLEMSVYPNPMCLSLNIELKSNSNLSEQSISASVYNIKGQIVKQIKLNKKSSRQFSAVWDGCDSQGKACSTGTYIIRLKTGNSQITKKIILIK